MSTRVVDRVDNWSEQSFSGGYAGLQELANGDFSGVVRAGGAEAYLTSGVVLDIRDGDITDFEQQSGTAYRAPCDALPLLAVMQERSDEVRGKYYTEQTALAEVDETLSDGGFTGYIELSENVLSGDYYLVYHAGESMSVAYVGEAKRLVEGTEAFETASDEVGIYEVRPAAVEPTDIPEPPEETTEQQSEHTEPSEEETDSSSGTESSQLTQTTQASEAASEQPDQPDPGEKTDESVQNASNEPAETKAADSSDPSSSAHAPTDVEPDASGSPTSATAEGTEVAGEPTDTVSGSAKTDTTTSTEPDDTGKPAPESLTDDPQSEKQQESGPEPQSVERGRRPSTAGSNEGSPTDVHTDVPDLETRAIPSLDPEQTKLPEQGTETASGAATASHAESPPQSEESMQTGDHRPASGVNLSGSGPAIQQSPGNIETQRGTGNQTDSSSEQLEKLQEDLEERETEVTRLEEKLEETREERAQLEQRLEEVTDERDELQAELDRLEAKVEDMAVGGSTEAERRITQGEALAGTDLFIRYRSKEDATLEKAHGGSTRRDAVNENLRLEKHTQFESDTVAVAGQTYDEFLEETVSYQFVEWIVRDLLFEIRNTNHKKPLQNLYNALPKVDRAELAGVVDVTYAEDGQETRTQESFDVVLRDRMGAPLLVANLNDSLEAATESMMETLITSAERVGQSVGEFSCAFLVTTSFFEPGALEVASEATKGGLLSRDKRKSFVNLSRKTGYHLCLVEARNENFHLAVPEL
jgi:regulator of replication initiation timing